MSQFKDLIERFPTTEALFTYLRSLEGGSLKVVERSNNAIIRYEKGTSDFKMSHVKAFRSVVWNKETHRPVSVTPFKSIEGESIPTDLITNYSIETFVDGILIGTYWNGTAWKMHTRSMLEANCRYYSQRTFRDLFEQIIPAHFYEVLDKTVCYSWILQHPENRIVCNIRSPRVFLVGANRIQTDGTVVPLTRSELTHVEEYLPREHIFSSWEAMKARLLEWNDRYQHNVQGFVIREVSTGIRWKLRTESYNKVRLMRDNTPRLDYIWLTQWKAHTFLVYLKIFPEEKRQADLILNRWKTVTTELFQLYTAKFKARSAPEVPPKFRSILQAMHQHYYNVLKPDGKTLTFREAVDWMNQRDIPQMLYLINYDLRPTTQEIPYESSNQASTEPASAEVASTEPASAEVASTEPASAEVASAEVASTEPASATPASAEVAPEIVAAVE